MHTYIHTYLRELERETTLALFHNPWRSPGELLEHDIVLQCPRRLRRLKTNRKMHMTHTNVAENYVCCHFRMRFSSTMLYHMI